MYICIYVYMYICIYVYMYICIYLHIYIFIYLHVYIFICLYIYIFIQTPEVSGLGLVLHIGFCTGRPKKAFYEPSDDHRTGQSLGFDLRVWVGASRFAGLGLMYQLPGTTGLRLCARMCVCACVFVCSSVCVCVSVLTRPQLCNVPDASTRILTFIVILRCRRAES